MEALTEKQIELITSKVIEIHEQQKESAEQKEKDKRLRNTKLLLQNYRSFKKYAEKIEGEKVEELEEVNVMELLIVGEDLVKSIKQTTKRTLVMVRHIDQALKTLEYFYSTEKDSRTRRQYDILHARYVKGALIREIAEENEIDDRNVYRAIDAAVERLTVILFGVYGLKIE